MLRTSGKFAAALTLTMILGAVASAGNYLGNFFGDVCPPHDCPRGEYCPLHFMLPGYYRLCACVHPSNLDQHLGMASASRERPEPRETAVAGHRRRCHPRSYADPAGYYGRSMTPYVGFGTVNGDAKWISLGGKSRTHGDQSNHGAALVG